MPKRLQNIILAFSAFFLAIILVLYPEETFRSSVRGLKIWWEVVFPAMLPFFITAELMVGLGIVHLIGILLEPIMRPVFRVPGAGAFVMAVSWISGNPMGAKLTAKLRQQGLVSQVEGERLIMFTSNVGPLFIFGAVSVGFFESSSVGIVLALAHYLSCIIIGILMRFYQASAPPTQPMSETSQEWIFFRAFRAMQKARQQDDRPLGQLLGDAVNSSVQTLLLIGGFIMLFSVIVHAITYLNPINLLSVEPFLAGIFEITLGSQMISENIVQIPLIYKLAIISVFFGWNGLSIQAQIMSILSRTDIRYRPYLVARILHGTLAGILTIILWKPLYPYLKNLPDDLPAMVSSASITPFPFWDLLQFISCMIAIGWFFYSVRKVFSLPRYKTR